MRILPWFLLLVSWCPAILGQDLFLQPPDLSPGDEYRLLFVTSKTRNAASTEIADYNAFVQGVADEAPIVGSWGLTWSVVGATAAVDARTNTGTDYGDGTEGFGVPIYRLDGVRVYDDYRQLWDSFEFGSSTVGGAAFTELGTLAESFDPFTSDVLAFTGTNSKGWAELPLGSEDFVGTGIADAISGNDRFSRYGRHPLQPLPFYAMSSVLTAVPEPSSSGILKCGLLVAAAAFRKCRHRRIAACGLAQG